MDGTRIPALERMGAELEAALLSRRRSRWRLRLAAVALAVCAALAVPAGAGWVDWAHVVGGETALPTQAPGRVVLEGGDAHTTQAWELVAYRAQLARGGQLGLCGYLVRRESGTGRCVPRAGAPALLVASSENGVIAGLSSDRVARIELTLRDGRSLAVAPETPDAKDLRRRDLPAGLRFFVVRTRPGRELIGAVARDAAGRELARSGRPGHRPVGAPTLQSPVTLAGKRP